MLKFERMSKLLKKYFALLNNCTVPKNKKLCRIQISLVESEANLEIIFFESLVKSKMESSEWLNIAKRLWNEKPAQWIQNYCSRKIKQTLNLSKKFFPTLELPINLFQSLSKVKVEECSK